MGTEIEPQDHRGRMISLPALNHQANDIIRRMFSGSVCDQSTGYNIAVIQLPTNEERGLLAARRQELITALKNHDKKEIGSAVGEMLLSYDVGRQKYTPQEMKVTVAAYLHNLQGVPTWAVVMACERIKMGTAPGISHTHVPTAIELRVLAVSIAEPFAAELSNIGKVLAAKKWIEPPNEEMRARVLPRLQKLAEQMKMDRRIERDAKMAKNAEEGLKRALEFVQRDYIAHGEELPQPLGGIVVSRFLKATIEEQEKARKALPPSEPMVL